MCDICYPPRPPGGSQSNTTNGEDIVLTITNGASSFTYGAPR